jgi:hypothetical protein
MKKTLATLLGALEIAYDMLVKIAAGGSYPAREYYERLDKISAAIAAGKLEKVGEAYSESV